MGLWTSIGAGVPSQAHEIWRRLTTRFTLEQRPLGPNQSEISSWIQPITSADDLLRENKAVDSGENLSGTQGDYVPYQTVPQNKRWQIQIVSRGSTAANTRVRVKVQGVLVPVSTSSTSNQVLEGIYPITLNEGDTIGLDATGSGSDTNSGLGLLYTEEITF